MTTKITTDNIQPNTVVTYSEFTENLLPKIGNVSVANSSYTVLDDTAVNVGGGYIVVSGAGFQDGATVIISGTQATSVSYVNSSTLHAQVPAKSAATYNLYVVNPDGGTAIGPNKLTYSGVPTWVTDTTLTPQNNAASFNISFSATGATSYSNTSELPTGTTLLSNGYFYGAVTVESSTTYNFTIRATDDEEQDSDRTFSLEIQTIAFLSATGGTVTTDGNYKIHTFTSNGTFEITSLGNPDNNIEYLIVGGGGAGGGSSYFDNGGGGGGGGVLRGNTTSATIGTYGVVVGAGGAAPNKYNDGSPTLATSGSVRGGKSSSWNGLTAYGGGAGGHGNNNGYPGASGGGAGNDYSANYSGGIGNRQNAPSALTTITGPVQGYNGGNGGSSGSTYNYGRGGGGGGAGAAGVGNAGGNGVLFYGTYYGGGGGGGAGPNESVGPGGLGGGGAGSRSTGTSGTNGLGGGGGGSAQGSGYNDQVSAPGGSGTVILRYKYQ
jgi:hypothetical protein